MTRPNLVYIFADQLRYQSLGYAGDPKALTPNIDRLASTSVNFVNAIAGSAVCTMDLSHIALGQPGPEPDAAFMQICGATADWQDGHEWRALRDKRYTYAIYRVDSRELLFDHVDDPYQLNDLAASPEHADILDDFRTHLTARMAAINDTFEACTWYRDHWTDGNRNIIRSATSGFTG